MSDENRESLGRAARVSKSAEDRARYLVQKKELYEALALAALLGDPAARLADPEYEKHADLSQLEVFREQILNIFNTPQPDFGEVPKGALEFFQNIIQQDFEARATIAHYELVQAGDKEPPVPAVVMQELMNHFQEFPHHLKEIAQMQRPALQLVPVYEPEGAGFQRMLTAYGDHIPQRLRAELEEEPSYVDLPLRDRWGMNGDAAPKIVGWQVSVVEGARQLFPERNPFLRGQDEQLQFLEKQYDDWQDYCQQKELQLCSKQSYLLLQMQEIRQAAPDVPLHQLGIDSRVCWTLIGDPTRQQGSFVPVANWGRIRVYFQEAIHTSRYNIAHGRSAVVVKKIL